MANDPKSIRFNSRSAGARFSATQPSVEFSSDASSVTMLDGGPLQRLLQENSGLLLTESGNTILKEQQ